MQGVSDRYDRVVRVLGIETVDAAVQQDICNEKALEEYDEWRYKYPELDTYQKRAKIPSQELSDYLVKELTKKEK